jgi:hypothetical protein
VVQDRLESIEVSEMRHRCLLGLRGKPTVAKAGSIGNLKLPAKPKLELLTHPNVTLSRYTLSPIMSIGDELGQDRCYLLCLETERSAPQLIHRWRRRSWIAFVFRALKHLLATAAYQGHSADAYEGHWV